MPAGLGARLFLFLLFGSDPSIPFLFLVIIVIIIVKGHGTLNGITAVVLPGQRRRDPGRGQWR